MKPTTAILVVALVALAWLFRWDVTPTGGADQISGVYMLNRWTGSLYVVYANQRIKVDDEFWKTDKPTPAINYGAGDRPAK